MPNPVLPAALKPLATGYQIGTPAGGIQVDVGGGPARFGLQWEGGQQAYDVTMLNTPSQQAVWTLFYQRVVSLGTIPFDMPLDSGFGVQAHTVNIVQNSYSASRAGTLWSVRFQVLATNPVYDLTDAEVQAMLEAGAIYGDGLGEMFSAINKLANIDSLVLDF